MAKATAKVSPKLLSEDDQESVKKAKRSPVESPLRNSYWRSETRLDDDKCLSLFLFRLVSKTSERHESKAIGR